MFQNQSRTSWDLVIQDGERPPYWILGKIADSRHNIAFKGLIASGISQNDAHKINSNGNRQYTHIKIICRNH